MCIFCKILDGSIPSTKLYESEHCIAIFDINPINPGHSLVISKQHYSQLSEASDEVMLDMLKTVKKLYPIINDVYDADGITTFENYGLHQQIDHIHFHILPVFETSPGINFELNATLDDSILGLNQIKLKLGEVNE